MTASSDGTPGYSLDVLTYRACEVPALAGFPEYLQAVSREFCRYIEPSATRQDTTYTVIRSDTADFETAERIVFVTSYLLTELLRQQRRNRPGLFCENVLFELPRIDEARGKELLGWPHWVLKCRYTEMGILFGKFWKNARENSKGGTPLPVPPYHFISIREPIRSKDPQFFEKAEWLRSVLEASDDKGQRVFDDLADCERIQTTVDTFCNTPTAVQFEQACMTVLGSDFYPEAKVLADTELKARKSANLN